MSAVAHITIIELKENPVMIYIQGRESTEALHVILGEVRVRDSEAILGRF